jgi:hypothetical protein
MLRYAVLIDAGFLKRKLGSREHPVDVRDVEDFVRALRAHDELIQKALYRIYYYDAPPLRRRLRARSTAARSISAIPGSHAPTSGCWPV